MHWTKTAEGKAKMAQAQKKAWEVRRAKAAAKAAKAAKPKQLKPSKLGMRVTTLHYEDGVLQREIHKLKSYGELFDLFLAIRVKGNDYEEVFIERFF